MVKRADKASAIFLSRGKGEHQQCRIICLRLSCFGSIFG
jgi:hypothetical protein